MNLHPYLMLIRPANIVTAMSDILAGAAIAGYFFELNTPSLLNLIFLLLSTSCLYAGGIVFNDIFDLDIDRTERPERPLPRGQVSLKNARFFGSNLSIRRASMASEAPSGELRRLQGRWSWARFSTLSLRLSTRNRS